MVRRHRHLRQGLRRRATADAGDRANDAVRIDGQANCTPRSIGEGANLGVTQRGRIEYRDAPAGGINYRFAIDNSAGVDCSDHEVNIKILLGQVVSGAATSTMKQRNDASREQMTDEVAALVLRDNYLQTQAI